VRQATEQGGEWEGKMRMGDGKQESDDVEGVWVLYTNLVREGWTPVGWTGTTWSGKPTPPACQGSVNRIDEQG